MWTHRVQVSNISWMGHQSVAGHHTYTHIAHTYLNLGAIWSSQAICWHVSKRWEETRDPGGKPHGHRESMQNSMKTVT